MRINPAEFTLCYAIHKFVIDLANSCISNNTIPLLLLNNFVISDLFVNIKVHQTGYSRAEDDTAGQKTYRTTIQKTIPRGTVPPNEYITDGPKTNKSTAENTKLSGVSQGSTMSRTGRKVKLQLQRHGSYHNTI
ncbi:hypothetical protein O6H91_Y190800 [Diphasiastrum complanatum]|nr:hypothetical protein O6H91_Y190800 [Diphasiastrum complanatum]